MINQRQRAVCYCPSELLFSADEARRFFYAGMAKLFMLASFLLLVWYKTRRSDFISIRIKLVVLFIYAGGMPMLIMGSIGLEYLKQKREQLIYQAQTQGFNVLRNLDKNFEVFLDDSARQISHLVENTDKNFADQVLKKETLALFRAEIIKRFKPNSIQIFNSKGQNLLPDVDQPIFADYTLTGQVALGIFKLVNAKFSETMLLPEDYALSVAEDVMTKKNVISYMGLATHELYRYFEFFGEPEKGKALAMIQLYWDLGKMQKFFFEQNLTTLEKENLLKQRKMLAYFPDEDQLYPESDKNMEILREIGQQAQTNQILRRDRLDLNSEEYTAVAMKGLNLNKISIIHLTPLREISRTMNELKKRMAVFALLIFSLTFAMFRLLSNHFLRPVQDIRKAIEAIDRRDFTYRLELNSSNEFRELANTFNNTLETLKDIETAKIVQENLLPAAAFKLGKIQLLSHSHTLSRIGGDYFDYFSPDQRNLGIFIGDVSGHGIAAALIMAMAKAIMICERNSFSSIEKLMAELDNLLYLNRKTGTKEYMTGLVMIIDPDTRTAQLINRGHCMPVLVTDKGEKVSAIKCGGLPLGFKSSDNSKVSIALSPGDFIILHTDGLIEAQNENGLALGQANFQQFIKESYREDMESFKDEILQRLAKWSASQNDDQTLVLIRIE
jgi:serine phosphatase RsbU (regulator of sigma subunit)